MAYAIAFYYNNMSLRGAERRGNRTPKEQPASFAIASCLNDEVVRLG
jgi:hypothetical protein